MNRGYRYRLGIDIGGTFTDFTLVNIETGETADLKVPTVSGAPEQGVARGLSILQDEYGLRLSEVQYLVHGMTIGLNTLLQRVGTPCALLTTEGFRDILNLQRMRLPVPYDFHSTLPDPLIERRFVYGIPERMAADGTELKPVDFSAVDSALTQALEQGIEAVAISFLHSYRNAAHEQAVMQHIRTKYPRVKACASSDIWPEIREYERTSIAVANLYIQKNVGAYFGNLQRILTENGLETMPFITQSNGGIMNFESASQAPIKTLFSGPAAGVIGAIREAKSAGRRNLLTFDMGGTSTDISVAIDGEPTYSGQSEVGGIPIVLPTIDIASVGAGGGSVAWIDQSGILKVGPESVGSNPGPACYGKGGKPALTDAFILCGYINPARFGGGRMSLDPARSETAIARLGEALGKDALDTADDIVSVSVANNYAEISNNMERHGYDPRELTVVAYGGGGPVTANLVASEIGARDVLVPFRPGTLCAMGSLAADFMHDEVAAVHTPLTDGALESLRESILKLTSRAKAWLEEQHADVIDETRAQLTFLADACYVGQSYEIQIPFARKDATLFSCEEVKQAFYAEHRRLYGHAEQDAPIEIVNLRTRIIAHTPALPTTEDHPALNEPATPDSHRRVRFSGKSYRANVYEREGLSSGQFLEGPAIVEQDDTTTVIIPGWHAWVDEHLNVIIERSETNDAKRLCQNAEGKPESCFEGSRIEEAEQ